MLHLFERFGIELEYMIVDRETLAVMPVCDTVISKANGGIVQNEIEQGAINWSNELVMHVIELKTGSPVQTLDGLSELFVQNVHTINGILREQNGMLLPGPMHPLMDPVADMHLWSYENSPIYDAFDRIFSCKGHGWSNLQSMHINLPFFDDLEFAKLHTAIRLILPIIPALSAGSPIADGVDTGFHDYRMEVYRVNSRKIPEITGGVVPELVFSQREYEEKILNSIYRALAPFDPEGILQEEWVNARGAIARFERKTIEIRVIDVQECPAADLAVAAAVTGIVQILTSEQYDSCDVKSEIDTGSLQEIFRLVIRDGEHAIIRNTEYLRRIGIGGTTCTAGAIWKYFLEQIDLKRPGYLDNYRQELLHIVHNGTLATRIRRSIGNRCSHENIINVYKELSGCLAENRML